jgi:hypothetical protein
MTGARAERELRRQQREAAHRSGPSTAALEAELWFSVVQHCEGMSDRAIVAEFGTAIEGLTGIKAQSKQRGIVSAARKTKGNRLWLTTAGGFGDEADRQMQQIAQDAQREADAYRATMAEQGAKSAGAPREPSLETSIRDAIVMDAAGNTAAERLAHANAALIEAGFDPIKKSRFYEIQKSSRGMRFSPPEA